MVMAISNTGSQNPTGHVQARRLGSLAAPRNAPPPPPVHNVPAQTLCQYARCFQDHGSNAAHMEAMQDLYGYND